MILSSRKFSASSSGRLDLGRAQVLLSLPLRPQLKFFQSSNMSGPGSPTKDLSVTGEASTAATNATPVECDVDEASRCDAEKSKKAENVLDDAKALTDDDSSAAMISDDSVKSMKLSDVADEQISKPSPDVGDRETDQDDLKPPGMIDDADDDDANQDSVDDDLRRSPKRARSDDESDRKAGTSILTTATQTSSSNSDGVATVAAAAAVVIGAQSPDSKTESPATKTLRKLGYGFNREGQLRQFDKSSGKLTDKKFEFRDQVSSCLDNSWWGDDSATL